MKVSAYFLGQPQVFLDGTELRIPQKKQFAFLLYMLYHGRCSRNSLIGVFWASLSEESARQNLRNMLYRLKKVLGEDFFTTDGRFVMISPAIKVVRDTDVVVMEDAGTRLLKMQSTNFMEHFYLRDTPEFEKWVASMQAAHEKVIVERLENFARESAHMVGKDCEAYAKKILTISPYHEEAVRTLIRRYSSKGMYAEAIDTYLQLVKRLEDDLAVEPEESTKAEYQRVLELREAHSISLQDRVVTQRHGRLLDELNKEYARFVEGKPYSHCILLGPMGAGKSTVIQSFCKRNEDSQFIHMRLEVGSANVPFYAIDRILTLLNEYCHLTMNVPSRCDPDMLKLYYTMMMDKVINHMREQDVRALLMIENIESVDQDSMDIFFSHLLAKCWGKIAIIGEYCTSFRANRQNVLRLHLTDHMQVLPVPPLNQQETIAYLSKQLSPMQKRMPDFQEIWTWTGGNLMLLDDVVAHIQSGDSNWRKASDLAAKHVAVLFSSLSLEESRFLETLSIFRYGVEIPVIAELLGITSVQAADVAEELYQRELLQEEYFDSILLIEISSHMLRAEIYEQIPRLKRIELHRASAEYYRAQSDSNHLSYHHARELKYHYEMVGWSYERVYYALKCFNYQLDYCDEFFPTIRSDPKIFDTIYLSKPNIYRSFDQLESMLGQLSAQISSEQMSSLEMTFSYLKGRTLIRDSRLEEGLSYIYRVISDAQQLGRGDLLLWSYLEIIFSGLRSENIALMRKYILLARELPDFSLFEKERGILLRLEAMCEIMEHHYSRAEEFLNQSITIMKGPKLRSSSAIHIAAAYDYLALIDRERGEYSLAVQRLEDAIELCVQNNAKKSLDLFYMDLGYIFFLQGDLAAAKESFTKSTEIYNQFDSCWLRSICESCMSMILAREGYNDKALESYHRAEIYSKKNHTQQEMNILQQAKEELVRLQVL